MSEMDDLREWLEYYDSIDDELTEEDAATWLDLLKREINWVI